MAMEVPEWLIPRETFADALTKGIAAGSAIASNRLRAQALYSQAQQQQQQFALQERQLVAQNERYNLQSELARTKMANDAADYATLREWWPKFSSASGEDVSALEVPQLHSPDTAIRMSALVTEKKRKQDMADFARSMVGVDLATPEGQKVYWDRMTPNMISKAGGIEQAFKPIEVATRLADARRKANETFEATSVTKNLDAANAKDAEALKVEATNPEAAAALRRDATLLRSTVTAPTETIESYTDESGKPAFRIVRGPTGTQKEPGALTTSTASQVQQRMLAAEKTAQMGVQLLNKLSGADVGVAGNVNQVLINEGLAQVIPGIQKGSVTEARTLLGTFNEQAMKAIASDPRISDRDRKNYERILPKMGPVESIDSAKDKIRTFIGEFRQSARADAAAAKLPIPNWALTPDEIRAKFRAVPPQMSEAEALKLLTTYVE